MFSINTDLDPALNLLTGMSKRAADTNTILDSIIRPSLMMSSKRSFDNQISPFGQKWKDSALAIKEGRPGKTMIRSSALYQEQQQVSSFPIEGDKLLEITGLIQGAVHNDGNWMFAGMDDQAIESVQNKTINYILNY